jgi:hypothetical protein
MAPILGWLSGIDPLVETDLFAEAQLAFRGLRRPLLGVAASLTTTVAAQLAEVTIGASMFLGRVAERFPGLKNELQPRYRDKMCLFRRGLIIHDEPPHLDLLAKWSKNSPHLLHF